MGAKRKQTKSQPNTPDKSPAQKKAKVLDPVDQAVLNVRNAINGDLGGELAPKAVFIVAAIIEDSLSGTAGDRSATEHKGAELVGLAIQEATASLAAKAATGAAELAQATAEVGVLTAAVEQAVAVKATCDAAVAAATAAEKEAKEAKNNASDGLDTQTEEESKLGETKDQLEEERSDLQFALETARGGVPSAKESKRLATILARVEAPAAMVAGVPAAIGKDSDLERMFVTEACKILDAKMAETLTKQAQWDLHTQSMAALTKQMEDQLAYLTAAHGERQAELAGRKADQKAAAQGIKDAEAGQKSGNKALVASRNSSDEANNALESAQKTYTDYQFLLHRSGEPEASPDASPDASPAWEETAEPTWEDL